MLVFDDSFEHEVWHRPIRPTGSAEPTGFTGSNSGAGPGSDSGGGDKDRLVLIVDLRHPDLSLEAALSQQ